MGSNLQNDVQYITDNNRTLNFFLKTNHNDIHKANATETSVCALCWIIVRGGGDNAARNREDTKPKPTGPGPTFAPETQLPHCSAFSVVRARLTMKKKARTNHKISRCLKPTSASDRPAEGAMTSNFPKCGFLMQDIGLVPNMRDSVEPAAPENHRTRTAIRRGPHRLTRRS